MTLSTPHCPMGEAITNGVKNALEAAGLTCEERRGGERPDLAEMQEL